jgi:hypothetical protein
VANFRPSSPVLPASYSPDGKWIVVSRTGRGGPPDLFAIHPDDTGLRQLTRSTVWDSPPDWGLARRLADPDLGRRAATLRRRRSPDRLFLVT